ncbi:MAG: hypothetical protein ABI700_03290 [Chloroflexota bacterium]
MARLPTPGGDDGNWGTVLNEYLGAEHNSDGTHGLASGLVTDVVNTQSSVGATYTLPAPTSAGIHYLTLTASCTLTFPTAVASQSFTLILKQGGSGSYTITWPGTVKWNGGTAPTLSTTAGQIDVLSFFSPDGTNWFGFVSGQNMS